LWLENGQLHYRGPKHALNPKELESLRQSRTEIVALLERATTAEAAEPMLKFQRRRSNRVPLTFSQLAHWHSFHLNERRSIRQIASGMRLRGGLNPDALRRGITEIVRWQEALRTRIIVRDGIPEQEVSTSDEWEMEFVDLIEVAEDLREREVRRLIDEYILEPIDVSVDPLFGIKLLRLSEDEHVLIVAMEHMISDMFSMSILWRDLFATYLQALNGSVVSLPSIPVQFADYAEWQRNAHDSWIEKHGSYWNDLIAEYHRPTFPGDRGFRPTARLGWGAVPLQIGKKLKSELHEWCRLRRTTVPMAVFTAYVGLVLRWCNASESVIRYQSDGRALPDIERTIGFFASPLYVHAALREDDSFVDLMKRVTEEYCTACEHADSFYVAAQVPQPQIARSCLFNWIPQKSTMDLSGMDGSMHAITCSQVHFAHPMLKILELDMDPSVVLVDTGEEIVGDLHFPLGRFSVDTMEGFARYLLLFVDALLLQPEQRIKSILLSR
jgi:hypothetical protein